jgi:hypothetical protein
VFGPAIAIDVGMGNFSSSQDKLQRLTCEDQIEPATCRFEILAAVAFRRRRDSGNTVTEMATISEVRFLVAK